MIFSCINCTERTAGCHSVCEKYIKEKAEYDKEKARIERERIINKYTQDSIDKYNDNMLRKKKNRIIHKTYL